MYGWVLKMFGTLLAKAMPSITRKIAEELAHRFKPIEKYVFEDNNLDVQMRDMEKKNTDNGFRITALETVVKDLGDDQHPPVIDLKEWEEVKTIIKKIKNKKAFKSLIG
tara:strand:+ start:1101 stop:1427 length:327 start_codon:yes stop_codon:yes gene_type:complete